MDTPTPERARRNRKSRGRGLRKTTGCLTCRRRHLKCDEEKPSCGPCSRSKQPCLYGPLSAPSSRRSTVVSTPSFRGDMSPVRENGIEWTGQREGNSRVQENGAIVVVSPDHERTQAASGLLHLNSAGNYDDTSDVMSRVDTENMYSASNDGRSETALYTADTPPDAAFSRWFGLLVSDISYDANGMPRTSNDLPVIRPSTADSEQVRCVAPSELHESSYPVRDSRFGRRERLSLSESSYVSSSTLSANHALEKAPWRGSEPSRFVAHEQKLFDNFVRNVTPWIDLLDPSRCFGIFVPHLAMHDAGLMNAVLALSARHQSISPTATEEQRDRNIGLQYYYQTLHYLQKGMQYDSYTTSLELLATALIVSTYEMLDESGDGGWERHLKGVFWIQRSQVIQGESGGLKAAVWWAWLRQDVWAAFRERRKTLSFWTPTKACNILDPHELACRSVWLFARAVDYSSNEAIDAGESDLQARIVRADRVLEMLEEWQRHLTVEFVPLPASSSTASDAFEPIWIHPPAFAVGIQLNCAARILLLLHRPSHGGRREFMEQQQILTKSVDTICGIAMTLMDDASSVMSAQCLFIAGMCVQGPRQRESLLSLIDLCQSRTGWPARSLSQELKDEWHGVIPT